MASKSAQHGSSSQGARRTVPPRLKPLETVLENAFLAQQAQPPNTALSVPLQQAISNLQSGGRGSLPGGFANLPNQGMQSREQLGLPDRRSYFPGLPTYDELKALGSFQDVPSIAEARKTARKHQIKPSPAQQSQEKR